MLNLRTRMMDWLLLDRKPESSHIRDRTKEGHRLPLHFLEPQASGVRR